MRKAETSFRYSFFPAMVDNAHCFTVKREAPIELQLHCGKFVVKYSLTMWRATDIVDFEEVYICVLNDGRR